MRSDSLTAPRPLRELADILAPARGGLARVESVLDQCAAASDIPTLHAVLRAVLGGPAKRLRPAIALLAGQGLGADESDLVLLAAGAEVLHSATLVHDDIVDDADARRGRPAVHVAWTQKVAVLAGDYLFATAADLIARLDRPTIVRQFADTIHAMSRSEFAAPVYTGDAADARTQYLAKIERKTASLIALPCRAAGVLANVDREAAAAVHDFGRALGMAFQITDDVLDVAGVSQRTGKPVGGDLRAGALTLPVIEYLDRAASPAPPLRGLAGGAPVPAEDVDAAIQALEAAGAVRAARAVGAEYAAQARAALARLPRTPAFLALADLVTYATNRTR